MPRTRVPLIKNFPYHIVARCINREWFELPLETVWSVMEDYLFLLSHGFGVKLHGFILMSNHFHMLVTDTRGELSAGLLYFMRETSKEMNRLSGRINQTYGGRNHKTLIRSRHHYMNAYKYIFRNPIRAGVVVNVEDYKYSTIRGIIGLDRISVPLAPDNVLFNPNFDPRALRWLNAAPLSGHELEIKLALRRPEMTLVPPKKTARPSALETMLL